MDYFYQDDFVTLYHGDNRDVMPCIDTGKIDLLLTDPPYGVGWPSGKARYYTRQSVDFLPALKALPSRTWTAIAGDADPFDPTPWISYPKAILWGANCYSDRLPKGRWLIWDKRFPSGKSFLLSDAEAAWVKSGHGIRIYAQTWSGVCRSKPHESERGPNGGMASLHPTQKPVALGIFCIELARNVKTMLDPYAGSGSFLCAAKTLGIRAIGIEVEEQYAETAARRLEMTCVQERLTDGNGNRL